MFKSPDSRLSASTGAILAAEGFLVGVELFLEQARLDPQEEESRQPRK